MTTSRRNIRNSNKRSRIAEVIGVFTLIAIGTGIGVGSVKWGVISPDNDRYVLKSNYDETNRALNACTTNQDNYRCKILDSLKLNIGLLNTDSDEVRIMIIDSLLKSIPYVKSFPLIPSIINDAYSKKINILIAHLHTFGSNQEKLRDIINNFYILDTTMNFLIFTRSDVTNSLKNNFLNLFPKSSRNIKNHIAIIRLDETPSQIQKNTLFEEIIKMLNIEVPNYFQTSCRQ
jgi:hypothetical protein